MIAKDYCNYALIKKNNIANGYGIRTAIFLSGCEHYCEECFNQELWDFNYGKKIDESFFNEIEKSMNKHIDGISILGGEPLHPNNIKSTLSILLWFRKKFPEKTIWVWTGYYLKDELFEKDFDLFSYNCMFRNIISSCDVIIDGKFDKTKKDYSLKWRGSSNQRVIDIKKSLKEGKVVIYE